MPAETGPVEIGRDALRIDVTSSVGVCPVYIGSGLLAGLPGLILEVQPARRIALITDDNVGALYGARVAESCRATGLEVTCLTFPAGEASKTRKSWSILTDEMLDARLGRDSCVVALGGGVTTDLAGFVAATYMRGVPVLGVPTSYLAMIDASVGGKTGVDVRAGKNLVGAFHPPVAVVADVDVLQTLPRAERAEGLVEAIKHGAILDEAYFDTLRNAAAALVAGDRSEAEAVVERSVTLKAGVVEQDEFEGGYRQVLNFGHTVGHAIEAGAAYTIGHGTAVALGMLAEAEIGERLGVTAAGTRARLDDVLRRIVPLEAPRVALSAALAYLGHDKKARGGRARFVLLEGIGSVSGGDGWSREVPDDVVHDVVTRMLTRS